MDFTHLFCSIHSVSCRRLKGSFTAPETMSLNKENYILKNYTRSTQSQEEEGKKAVCTVRACHFHVLLVLSPELAAIAMAQSCSSTEQHIVTALC